MINLKYQHVEVEVVDMDMQYYCAILQYYFDNNTNDKLFITTFLGCCMADSMTIFILPQKFC